MGIRCVHMIIPYHVDRIDESIHSVEKLNNRKMKYMYKRRKIKLNKMIERIKRGSKKLVSSALRSTVCSWLDLFVVLCIRSSEIHRLIWEQWVWWVKERKDWSTDTSCYQSYHIFTRPSHASTCSLFTL